MGEKPAGCCVPSSESCQNEISRKFDSAHWRFYLAARQMRPLLKMYSKKVHILIPEELNLTLKFQLVVLSSIFILSQMWDYHDNSVPAFAMLPEVW